MNPVGYVVTVILAVVAAWILLGLIELGDVVSTGGDILIAAVLLTVALLVGIAGGALRRGRSDTVYW